MSGAACTLPEQEKRRSWLLAATMHSQRSAPLHFLPRPILQEAHQAHGGWSAGLAKQVHTQKYQPCNMSDERWATPAAICA